MLAEGIIKAIVLVLVVVTIGIIAHAIAYVASGESEVGVCRNAAELAQYMKEMDWENQMVRDEIEGELAEAQGRANCPDRPFLISGD